MENSEQQSKRQTRVYVAGAYSADNVIEVLQNMRVGMKAAKDVLLAGFAPFAPWFDHYFSLMLDEGESLTVGQYYQYSLAWLEASDCMVIVSGCSGTQRQTYCAHCDLRLDMCDLSGCASCPRCHGQDYREQLVPDFTSKGVLAEYIRAQELGIPIYRTLKDLFAREPRWRER